MKFARGWDGRATALGAGGGKLGNVENPVTGGGLPVVDLIFALFPSDALVVVVELLGFDGGTAFFEKQTDTLWEVGRRGWFLFLFTRFLFFFKYIYIINIIYIFRYIYYARGAFGGIAQPVHFLDGLVVVNWGLVDGIIC